MYTILYISSRFAEFINSSAHISTRTVEKYEKEIHEHDMEFSDSENEYSIEGIKELDYSTSETE